MADDTDSICVDCGFGPLDEDWQDFDGVYRCDECLAAKVAKGLLSDARDGCDTFLADLAEQASRHAGTDCNEVERLIVEASDAAARGDADEAVHRLRLAAEPKFESLDDCKQQYQKAMADKRARGVSV